MTKNDVIDGDFFESLGNEHDIIYSNIDNVEKCFHTTEHHRVLITHNGDRNISESLYQEFKRCGKYDIWYAQNVGCKHEDLRCIPIGFERERWCKFNKVDVMKRCKNQYNEHPTKTLYANFSIGTKADKRFDCIRSFIGKEYLTNKVQTFVPSVKTITEKQYEDYCNDILDHRFVLCPEGNGIDTHRFWETLYLGRIPVVLHNCVTDAFMDVPVLRLDKWGDFEDEYESFLKQYQESNYSYESLNTDHWRKIIKC